MATGCHGRFKQFQALGILGTVKIVPSKSGFSNFWLGHVGTREVGGLTTRVLSKAQLGCHGVICWDCQNLPVLDGGPAPSCTWFPLKHETWKPHEGGKTCLFHVTPNSEQGLCFLSDCLIMKYSRTQLLSLAAGDVDSKELLWLGLEI